MLTTLDGTTDRVGMHGVPRALVEAQAEALGLPLVAVPLPWPAANAVYEAAVRDALADARRTLGVTHMAFGDLFLEDIHRYRGSLLSDTRLVPLFPLWGTPTEVLAREMIAGGLRATLTCVNPACLHASFAGRAFNADLLADLPASADPCGENGEFHTFAWDGPMFRHPVPVRVGARTERDGFVYADLCPAGES